VKTPLIATVVSTAALTSILIGGIALAQMRAGPGGPPASNDEMQRMMAERQGGGPERDMMGMGMMGMGRGMMEDGMMGMMGGMGAFEVLDLSDEQRGKIRKIGDELRRANWATQGKVLDEEAKLRELYDVDKRDPKAIGAVYGAVFNLKRQMIEATIEAHNRMEALLTPAQREQLKQSRRGRMMDGPGAGMGSRGGHGPGGMPGGMMGR
jgi:Spy/CpxP family protein refolding chaperone